jgi:hypothetical protein
MKQRVPGFPQDMFGMVEYSRGVPGTKTSAGHNYHMK